MAKCLIALVASSALPCVLVAKVDRMLKHSVGGSYRFAGIGLVNGGMADAALIPDDLAVTAHMLPVVAAKTSLRVIVADVVE